MQKPCIIKGYKAISRRKHTKVDSESCWCEIVGGGKNPENNDDETRLPWLQRDKNIPLWGWAKGECTSCFRWLCASYKNSLNSVLSEKWHRWVRNTTGVKNKCINTEKGVSCVDVLLLAKQQLFEI